jgi:acetylornithine deacetylase/succinyl-diaminopimelate desuccinylase-like protein
VAVLVVAAVSNARAADLDWRALGDETSALLAELIRVDTTNPPGAEAPAAEILARKLRADGIAAEVVESAPGRGNLQARLRGRGGARPIVLLSHLDVVPADAREWDVPPFAGVVRDGYLYGRGALDAKGIAAVQTMAVIAIARSGERLDRDVILLATADEETGGRAGAGWIVANRPDLLADAELLLTEGDHIHPRATARGPRLVAQVAVAEKTPAWVRLTATGPGGHGAAPPSATAVTRLVRALGRVESLRMPIRVVPSVARYFAALASIEEPPLRRRFTDLDSALRNPAFRAEFTRNGRQNALVRDTVTPTVLRAGSKTNVIPTTASADLDCRLLPGEDGGAFVDRLRRTVADEHVRVEPLLVFGSSSSPPESPVVTAVRELAKSHLEGAPVVPSVIAGFTDSHYFRARGIASYGFVPFVLTLGETRRVHGVDERVALAELRDGTERLVELLRAVPTAP